MHTLRKGRINFEKKNIHGHVSRGPSLDSWISEKRDYAKIYKSVIFLSGSLGVIKSRRYDIDTRNTLGCERVCARGIEGEKLYSKKKKREKKNRKSVL